MTVSNHPVEVKTRGVERFADGIIATAECFAVRLALKKPLVMSTYRLDDGPSFFVRVRAENGVEGWGEAAASIVMSGETLEGMRASFNAYAVPAIVGTHASNRVSTMIGLQHGMYGNTAMQAAVDMALLDLAARLQGVPAVELLGGKTRSAAMILRLIGGSGDTNRDVDDALALREEGYRAFKLKVGVAPIGTEVKTVHSLREALGSSVVIGADANMGWTRSEATQFAKGVQNAQLDFLEQPLRPGDVAGLSQLALRTSIPLCIDESLHGTSDLLTHFKADALHGASLKTIKLGGIAPLVRIATVCDGLGLPVNLAMMMESTLATAAMVHAACAIPELSWGLSLGSLWIQDDPNGPKVECVDGFALLPAGPGFGVFPDVDKLTELAKSYLQNS